MNQTTVTAYQSEARISIDPSTGLAAGERQYAPITFTKPFSAASPQLLQALVTNEVLANVTFDFVQNAADGTQQAVLRVQLKNALVTDIKQHPASAAHAAWLEDVSLVFQSITVTHLPTSITVTDSLP